MPKLDVPLILQQDSHSCVPVCLKMILNYFSIIVENGNAKESLQEIKVEDIANSIKTTIAGTALENIKNLNKNEKVLSIIPSIEFEDKIMCTLSEIETEIKENRPMVTWILLQIPPKKFVHSVVITGLDMDKQKIYYNDPIFGETEEFIGKFMQMWENVDKIAVKVKIGKREQKLLDEWFRITYNEEGNN